MKLIVDIPDVMYEDIKSGKDGYSNYVHTAIRNGTPLPKGHGRIMDADKIIKKMEEREEQLKDDRSIWETAGVETAVDMFGKTIIESDKESEENDR